MKWLLADENVPGLNPNTDAAYLSNSLEQIPVEAPDQAAGGWCAFTGQHFIIHDFMGGGHSNWSEAFSSEGCPEGSGGGSGTLPDTGASSTAGIVAGALGLVAVAGGLMLVRARRLGANGN